MIRCETTPDGADSMAAIGVDIGNTNHTAALVSSTGEPLEMLRRKTDRTGGPAALMSSLAELLPDLEADARDRGLGISGIGVGFGGPVDFDSGTLVLSHQNPGWEGFPLRDQLRMLSGLRVVVDNDANAGGLGEFRFGAGRGVQDMIYYNIGTGIGGAIVLGGQLRRGPSTCAGEIGHVIVYPDGPVCTCGQRGCLEAVAAGPAISRRLAELSLEWQGRPATAEDLFAMVSSGTPGAAQVLGEVVEALAIAVRNIIHTLNPELVVLGGGVGSTGEILSPLIERLGEITFPTAFRACRFEGARLGYQAGVIGAAALVL